MKKKLVVLLLISAGLFLVTVIFFSRSRIPIFSQLSLPFLKPLPFTQHDGTVLPVGYTSELDNQMGFLLVARLKDVSTTNGETTAKIETGKDETINTASVLLSRLEDQSPFILQQQNTYELFPESANTKVTRLEFAEVAIKVADYKNQDVILVFLFKNIGQLTSEEHVECNQAFYDFLTLRKNMSTDLDCLPYANQLSVYEDF